MIKLGIVIGSTRPGRNGEAVARWVHDLAGKRGDAACELVDLLDYRLPHLDEPLPPQLGRYANAHTRRWAAKVASLDAFVFVTPEYNHAPPGALKNAIDYLYQEWNNKSAGLVGYGMTGGASAVDSLRLVLGQLMVADVGAQVALSLTTDFRNFSMFAPAARHEDAVNTMLDQVVAWGTALRALRRT
jgi:NAD(P)H-dependent FMN reductase